MGGPLLLILTNLFWGSQAEFEADLNKGSPCYQMLQDGTDDLNKALRCMPPFQNVISNARVSVRPEEMTCGVAHQVEYCMQSGGYYRECQICDSTLPDKHHNATYLTDIHTDLNQTSWLSVTMNERVHESHSVEATEKVKQAKRELEEISQILSSVQIHDSNFLDDLERRLAVAERKYQEADLEEKLRQLEEAKQRQLERKAALKNEYDMVTGEFETIGNILQQLSEYKSCPNKKDPLLEV